jgi:hypothetical protein
VEKCAEKNEHALEKAIVAASLRFAQNLCRIHLAGCTMDCVCLFKIALQIVEPLGSSIHGSF